MPSKYVIAVARTFREAIGDCRARRRRLYRTEGGFVIVTDRYKQAGVDIDAGNALVNAIRPMVDTTTRSGVAGDLGGFGGLFDLRAAGYRDPILVAATDGVGTKLKIAIETGRHDSVGVDLVAMCVNDLVVQGAEPLFFLDYFATGKLSVDAATEIVRGIAEGCKQAGCALIGGETAEMPGMYQAGDYDLAGFAVGAAERGALIDGSTVTEGDVILGLASNGVHSNGFSLVRRVVEQAGLGFNDTAPFNNKLTLGEALLAPTRIYVRPCLDAIRSDGVKALAHITGGGLVENIPRVLPKGLGAEIDAKTWKAPPVFGWLAEHGDIPRDDMARTFNCGIGMAMIVAPDAAEPTIDRLKNAGESALKIGRVVAGTGVSISGWADEWPRAS